MVLDGVRAPHRAVATIARVHRFCRAAESAGQLRWERARIEREIEERIVEKLRLQFEAAVAEQQQDEAAELVDRIV